MEESAFRHVGGQEGNFELVTDAAKRPTAAASEVGPFTRCLNKMSGNILVLALAALVLLLVILKDLPRLLGGGAGGGGAAGVGEGDAGDAGSLKTSSASHQQCFKEAVVNAASGKTVPLPHLVFNMSLEHKMTERFGIELEAQEASLSVMRVSGGIVGAWNSAHPARELKAGDVIVRVNDQAGSALKMLSEIGNHESLKVMVLRAVCVDNATSATKPPSAPSPAPEPGAKKDLDQGEEKKNSMTKGNAHTGNETEPCLGGDCPEASQKWRCENTTVGGKYIWRCHGKRKVEEEEVEVEEEGHGQWACHDWTASEDAMLRDPSVNEAEVCTRHRSGDDREYRYTQGNVLVAPGCSCWCCYRSSDVAAPPGVATGAGMAVVSKHPVFWFKQGSDDYDGLVMRQLHLGKEADDGATVMTVAAPGSQVLMRFDDIIGFGVHQIPFGCQISLAKLSVNVVNPGGGVELHRLIVPWTTSTTYKELGGDGVTLDEVDGSLLDAVEEVKTGNLEIDLTGAVQAWANGEHNYGIAILPLDADDVEFTSTRSMTPPTMSVEVSEDCNAEALNPRWAKEEEREHGLGLSFYFGIDPFCDDWQDAVHGRDPDLVRTIPSADCPHESLCWEGVRKDAPFVAIWSGRLTVQKAGTYRFKLVSDDIAELSVDARVLVGGKQNGFAVGPLIERDDKVASVDLSKGTHSISITLMQLDTEDKFAMDCRYEGPDTNGVRTSIPGAALSPVLQSSDKGTHDEHFQRKFVAEQSVQSSFAPSAGLAAAALLVVSALVAAAPGLKVAVVEPLRARWRNDRQQRSMRRYDSLAALVEGTSTAGGGAVAVAVECAEA